MNRNVSICRRLKTKQPLSQLDFLCPNQLIAKVVQNSSFAKGRHVHNDVQNIIICDVKYMASYGQKRTKRLLLSFNSLKIIWLRFFRFNTIVLSKLTTSPAVSKATRAKTKADTTKNLLIISSSKTIVYSSSVCIYKSVKKRNFVIVATSLSPL